MADAGCGRIVNPKIRINELRHPAVMRVKIGFDNGVLFNRASFDVLMIMVNVTVMTDMTV
jgi:hypothetical protein